MHKAIEPPTGHKPSIKQVEDWEIIVEFLFLMNLCQTSPHASALSHVALGKASG